MANRSPAVAFDGRRLVALRGSVLPKFTGSPADRARMKCQVLADSAPLSWVECAYESEWHGHPMGAFEFTSEVFADVIRIFNADEQPIPFLYGHPRHDMGHAIDAAGWIQAFEVRGSELWALVEWTDDAADKIKTGKQRFCSVVIDFAPIDRVTGEPSGRGEIFEIGLTPSPFLPGMTPITLSRAGTPARNSRSLMANPNDPNKVLDAVSAALGMKKGSSPEKIKATLDALVALASALADEAPPAMAAADAPSDEAKMSHALSVVRKHFALMDGMVYDDVEESDADTGAAMLADKLMTLTGMDAPTLLAAVEANGDALVALLSGTAASGMSSDAPAAAATLARDADRGRIVELTARANAQATQIAALTADLAKRTAAETETRIAASFARLLTEGKAGESERATFLSLSAQSESIALSAYDTRLPVLPPSGQVASGAVGAPAKATTHTSTADVSQLGLTDPRSLARQASRSRGLKGAVAAEFETRWLAKHAERHTSA